MSEVAPPVPTPRLLRPYASDLHYSPAHPVPGSLGRKILSKRPLCPVTLQGMSMADLMVTMEHVGFLPPRPRCPICSLLFSLEFLDTRSREVELDLGGGVVARRMVQPAMWHCPGHRYISIFTGAELLNPRWPLLQNALLLWHWAQPHEPSADALAHLAYVDRKSLLEGGQHRGQQGRAGWLTTLRKFVAEEQERADMAAQVGGMGADCEADEVSFRAKAVRGDDGRMGGAVVALHLFCRARLTAASASLPR